MSEAARHLSRPRGGVLIACSVAALIRSWKVSKRSQVIAVSKVSEIWRLGRRPSWVVRSQNEYGTWLGAENSMPRWHSSRPKHRLIVWGVCGLICLAVAGPAPGAGNTFDGVYTGKRSLTKGPTPWCPVEENVSVTIHGDTLTFTDSALQNFVMGFDPQPDGSFSDISTNIGGAATVVIRGRITGYSIEADVTENDMCEHHWHLTREHRGQ